MNDEFKFHKSAIEWRRGIVLQKLSQGYSQSEIAKELQLHPSTISLDCQCLRLRAQENIKNHIEERIPAQYEECHTGLKIVLRKAWEISNNSSNKTSEVLQALSLISDTYGKIMDLTTDGTTLEQAMNFIAKSKRKGKEQLQLQSQQSQQEEDEDEDEDEEKQNAS